MPELANTLSDKPWTKIQIGDTMYLHNITDGFRTWDGTDWGTITPAATAPGAIVYAGLVAGSMTAEATYRYKITFVNPAMGIESEGSAEFARTLGATETGAKLTLPSPTAPYTYTRVYRTVANGNAYFLEGETDETTFNSTASDSTLGITLDTTIDVMAALPLGNYIYAYKGHLVVLQDATIRYCRLVAEDSVQYWLETDKYTIPTTFGVITGGGVVGDTALAFTAASIHGFSGSSPSSFTFRTLKEGMGCASHFTIDSTSDGDLVMFGGTSGVLVLKENDLKRLTESGQTLDVKVISKGMEKIFQGRDREIKLNPSEYYKARGFIDTDENIYHLYVSGHHFIFNLSTGQIGHESDIEVTQAVFVKTSTQHSGGYLVNNQGMLLREDVSFTKLAPTGTITGAPTSGVRLELRDTIATFETLGDGLKGVYVVVDHDTHIETRQIVSNNQTVLTVDAPWDMIPSATDKYYIGYIHCRILTKQFSLAENVSNKIRNHSFAILHELSQESQEILVKWFYDKKSIPVNSQVFDLTTKIYDEVPMPMRGRFIQVYMYTHYNSQHDGTECDAGWRTKVPLNITNYVFFIDEKGKV